MSRKGKCSAQNCRIHAYVESEKRSIEFFLADVQLLGPM